MAKTHTFSLYLAKDEVSDFDDLLTDNARGLLKSGAAKKSTSKDIGDEAAVYVFPGTPTPPRWVSLIQPHFSLPRNISVQAPCALLAFKKESSIFALTFSFAHVYLDDAKTESEFGLRAAINAVSEDKLRSVERTNLGAAIRDFAQSAGLSNIRSFGIDETLDLIRKVSGHTTSEEVGDKVTGARSLRFSTDSALRDIPENAVAAVGFFKSKAYKNTSFKIIDFLSPVLDPVVEADLNKALVGSVSAGDDDFEIAIPDILPQSVGSFRFEQAGVSDWFPDLSLELYQESFGDDLEELTLDNLKKHKVAAYDYDGDRLLDRWSVHHSLVGSINVGGERYALNEGKWFKIGKRIKDSADEKFDAVLAKADKHFVPLTQKSQSGKGRLKAAYQSEESYNAETAKRSGYLLMDRKLVESADIVGGIEACDLLDIPGRRFIHVKKSSRQSSILSHFFKQGGNAAKMLRWYDSFKSGLIDKVGDEHGARSARDFKSALAGNDRWTVEFRIADFPRRDGAFNIPFFSKLTLQDEARKIEAMNFDVSLGFIKLSKAHVPKGKK